MLVLYRLAEKKIKTAIENGELDDLPGQGKLLVFDDDSAVPPELRSGYRILKNAGFLPKELQLRKDVRQVEELLLLADSVCEKERLVQKISLLKSQL